MHVGCTFAIVCDIKSMMMLMMMVMMMMTMIIYLHLGSSKAMESASHPSLLCRDAIGHQGAPDCPWPHPPAQAPGPPLINDISDSSPSNESFSTLTPIVFGALSDGINPTS